MTILLQIKIQDKFNKFNIVRIILTCKKVRCINGFLSSNSTIQLKMLILYK